MAHEKMTHMAISIMQYIFSPFTLLVYIYQCKTANTTKLRKSTQCH